MMAALAAAQLGAILAALALGFRKSTRLAAIVAAIVAATAVAGIVAAPAHASDYGMHWQACQEGTDVPGIRCVWDARHMGNGIGHSYLIRRDGSLHYITHRKAHALYFGEGDA